MTRPRAAGRGGRPEKHCRRTVVDAIRHVVHNGCVWQALPADFPPWRTVYGIYLPWAARLGVTVQIVRRPDDLHTFQVLPRRWVVERTLAWITSYRRCARDYERLTSHHEAMILWAMIIIMSRRLARTS